MSDERNSMSDRILIRDLLVRGVVGVNEWERRVRQDILIDIDLYADLAPAGSSDDIDDTVNYKEISKAVIDLVEKSRRFTVEALAADIAEICLGFPKTNSVRVRVEKPGALRFARSVGVEIQRTRQ